MSEYNLNFKSLLAIYFIVPLIVAMIIFDQTLGDEILLNSLPSSPNSIAIYSIFFGLPHIIAGHQIILNTKHRAHFKSKILIASIVSISIIIFIPLIFPLTITLSLYTLIVLNHVLKQQFGLTSMFSSVKGTLMKVWTSLAILIASLIALHVFGQNIIQSHLIKPLYFTIITLTFLYLVIGLYLYPSAKTPHGKFYFLANFSLIPLGVVFYSLGYSFFAILSLRVIHDITAFLIYINHDKNINFKKYHLSIINTLSIIKIIGLSIAIAYFLNSLLSSVTISLFGNYLSRHLIELTVFSLIVYLELMHYYLESIAWKNNSPCRKYLHITHT